MLSQKELIEKCAAIAHSAFMEAMSSDPRMTLDDATEKGRFICQCILSLRDTEVEPEKMKKKRSKGT